MTVRISTAARNAMVGAIAALVDGGSGAGKLRVYTGSQPAGGPGSAATGTLLLEITLNDPAFDAAASGSAALDVSPALSGTGVADGTAGWARILDSANTAVVDGSVTATGGGGDITVSTTAISTGLTVNLTGLTLTQPAN